jgi:hypothetical protein
LAFHMDEPNAEIEAAQTATALREKPEISLFE